VLIRSHRYGLRIKSAPVDDGSIKEIIGWLNNPKIVRFSEQRHTLHTMQSQRLYICELGQADHYLGIYSYDLLIGTITATMDVSNKVANVGIMIGDQSYWGKGFGFDAWSTVCDWLLNNHVRKIEAGCMCCNNAMMSICSHYGMMEEGRQEDHFLYHDIPMDLVHWGKLK
jgi:ribosomal-protein-alanine N-acetyltransferase